MSAFQVVIPARFGSTRLPGKPLADLGGRPMIQWVWELARQSGAESVTIATDHPEVEAACQGFGAEVCLTAATHASGTDRIAEVATLRGWYDDVLVVNVQGDEPLLPPELVRQVAALLERHPAADIGTLGTPIQSLEEYLDPNVVKLVQAADGRALYFSRAPIPWHRGHSGADPAAEQRFSGAMRHLGSYGYRVAALQRVAATAPCRLEEIERLEQLRALWLGMRIQVDVAHTVPPPGIDTPADLARVNRWLGDRRAR